MKLPLAARIPLRKQIRVMLSILFCALWLLIAFNLQRLHHHTVDSARTENLNLAHAFSEEVQSSINAVDYTLIDLRERWQGGPAAFAAAVRRRQAYLENEMVFQVSIVDASGKLAFSNVNPSAKPLDLSDREYFRMHQQSTIDQLHISEPLRGRISQRWLIQFTRPLLDADGKFDGAIVLSVAPQYFSRFYETIDLGADSTITLVRNNGDILARSPNPPLAMGKALTGSFLNAGKAISGIYQQPSEVDGIERLYVWRALPKYDLRVIIGQSLPSLFDAYYEQRRIYLLAGVGMSALLGWIWYFMITGSRQRARSLTELAESEARWKFALEGAGDGVWDWNVQTGDVLFSRRWQEMLGYAENEIAPHMGEWRKRVHPDDEQEFTASLQRHLDRQTPAFIQEYRIQCKDGGFKWVLARGMVVSHGEQGALLRMVGTQVDITEQKTNEESIHHRAQHDALTGLPNRTLLTDRLRQAIIKAKRDTACLALMYLDLDKFKPVNDTYGHPTGDLLLKEVAARMQKCLRESDTVARIGGDEFVVLLPAITAQQDARLIGEQLRSALSKPFDIAGHRLHISASIGIAVYPVHGNNETALSTNADKAMYRAKENGRNAVEIYKLDEA